MNEKREQIALSYQNQSLRSKILDACYDKTDQWRNRYNDVIMSRMASQITSLTIVCSTVYSGADQRTHKSSASLAFVCGIHRWPVNSPHKGTVTRKMFPFDDVIMWWPTEVIPSSCWGCRCPCCWCQLQQRFLMPPCQWQGTTRACPE